MNQKGNVNIILVIIIVALVGAGAYFILNRQAQPTPRLITVSGEITCLPKKGQGGSEECAIGLRGTNGQHYGLKNVFKLDPENKFSVTGLRVEISGTFNPEEMKGPYGSKYDAVGTIDVISIKKVEGSTQSNFEKIIRTVGEKESSFLIQKINPNNVDGRWYEIYPIEIPNDPGIPKTLHIGDDIGYVCEGVSEKLTSINFSGQTITFTKAKVIPSYGGCPICLDGNTLIDTPSGLVPVKNLQVGMSVWTTDKTGQRVSGVITKTSKVPVPLTHQMIHLVLANGRGLFVSPGHPTIDERIVWDLSVGDIYDGSTVASVERVSYDQEATYDILPSGETGFYWANGILLNSTLNYE
ncbi:MAG: Hint domain-containing protein [Candidatus Levybacteria bacterium]|nr:Hint domain-containing protein [Candidatus Levybacteria bacterium]